ncbi:MAG: KH domain-containing protein [Thermoleophilia bacterium]|nr:KH domain-containing protein [Thermoleophilia bacterium]
MSEAVVAEMVARIARAMVEHPDEVSASVGDERGEPVVDLMVAESDRGQVIGRAGRGANAFRVLLRAATGPRSQGGLGLRIVD